MFVRKREGRPARVTDLSKETVQAWMDQMAESNLAQSTMRVRQSTLSSLCSWLVKRESLADNSVAKLDRPRYERTPPNQVPNAELMDAVYTKGSKTRDIPLPSVVTKFLQSYVDLVVAPEVGEVTGDTPLFWSRWAGRRGARRVMPIQGKNIWRLCKTYGRLIGVPELKPHDLRHGVAMEVLEQHHDLEQVRALLGHTRVDTTQIYATIRPSGPAQARGRVLRGQGFTHAGG